MRTLSLVLALGATITGCGAPTASSLPVPPPTSTTPASTVVTSRPPPPELTWSPCEDGAGECTSFEAPRDYASADGRFEVALRRFVGKGDGPRAQLWYLAGGPGGAGTSLLPLLQKRYGARWDTRVDFYAMDHRGTGGSGRLSCPEQEATTSPGAIAVAPSEFDACIAHLRETHGNTLQHTTISNAAHDLALAIEATRGDAKVLLWGNSYGTYWAQRFLALYPDRVDGAYLEALALGKETYRPFDHWMHRIGSRLMVACAQDEACRTQFGADPVATAKSLPARLAKGHCSALKFDTSVSWFLGSMLYDTDLRALVPLLVRMIDRCNPADVKRVQGFYDVTFRDQGMLTAGDFCTPLYDHVLLSEMWGGRPPEGTVAEMATSCLFCPGDRAALDEVKPRWPTYTPPVEPPLEYEGPLWLLQGGLDPAAPPTPVLENAKSYASPKRHFIVFPTAAHTLPGKTPTPEGDCALGLLDAFIDDPTATPDASCAQTAAPLVVHGSKLEGMVGGPDAWAGK